MRDGTHSNNRPGRLVLKEKYENNNKKKKKTRTTNSIYTIRWPIYEL